MQTFTLTTTTAVARPAGGIWVRTPEDQKQPGRNFVIGVDVGQRRDATTVAVTEITRDDDTGADRYHTRLLRAMPLGTPYPEVARNLIITLGSTIARGKADDRRDPMVAMLIDATGIGRGVLDGVRAGLREIGARRFDRWPEFRDWSEEARRLLVAAPVFGVTITGGVNRLSKDRRELSVSKLSLVSRLASVIANRTVQLPATLDPREVAAIEQEIRDYEGRQRETDGHTTFGAHRTGAHDDLVTALALSVLWQPPRLGSARTY